MSEQMDLIEVPVVQRPLRPAKRETIYLLATYRDHGEGLRYWKIWPELYIANPDTGGVPDILERAISNLASCWTHIRILGPVVLE